MTTSTKIPLRARTVRFLFGLLYKNRALYWLASTIPFAGQWRRWQRLVLPRLVGHDVLEVGCGIGTLLADMVAAGYACSRDRPLATDGGCHARAAAAQGLARAHPRTQWQRAGAALRRRQL